MTMNALDELLSRHDRECGVNVYISEPYECTCGRAEAAYELAELRAVVEAARKLQVKMLRVYNTPEYQTVWSIAQSHVGKYEGGNWIDEFDELAAELARVDGEK